MNRRGMAIALLLTAWGLGVSAREFPFVIGFDRLAPIVSMRPLAASGTCGVARVFVRDGHFATAQGPVRFNAINLTGSANLPSRDHAERMADRLAAFGINCVRLHFLDAPKGYGTFMLPGEPCLIDDTDDPFDYRVNPERLDRLEYLIAAFKRHGIYVNLNLHVARFMGHRMKDAKNLKGRTWLDRRIVDSEKRYAREFLTHRNPYTGLTLAEDPVVAMIELNNEDAAFDACHKEVCAGGAEAAEKTATAERRYLEEMRALIKDELKCPAPLAGTQVTYTSAHVQSCLDYFDAHEYWCHPSPVNENWLVADLPQVNHPTDNPIAWLAARRVKGCPFTVSEYNNPYPNRCGTEGHILLHAYGAYQGWDGLFAYSYDNRQDREPDHVEYFFSLAGRTDVLAHLPACAAFYLRGDVKTTTNVLAVAGTREAWLNRFQKDHVIYDDVTQASEGRVPYGAGLVRGLTFAIDGSRGGREAMALPKEVFFSDTRELEWNASVSNAGYVAIRTANTKAFTGFVRGRTFDLGEGVALKIGPTERDWATVSLVSKTANGFGSKGASSILFALTGQAHNKDAKFTEYKQKDGTIKIATRGADWGTGPFVVEGVPATVTLPATAAHCWALDGHGERMREVPVKVATQGVEIVVGPEYDTVWYEIATFVPYQNDLRVVPSVRCWMPTQGKSGRLDAVAVETVDASSVGGPEGYRLTLSASGARIAAATPSGFAHARATLAQLRTAYGDSVPAGVIEDAPKYRVRAAMLDVARKYYPLGFLDRLVDELAFYKFNEFHVHLNDNGPGTNWAFRIACETYPGLTSCDGSYSKTDFRAFVKRSVAKGVNIVPEIDAPAHSRAFIRYNPAFGSKEYGDTHLDLHNPEIIPFFEKLYAEYLGGTDPVFAGPDFSVGTDEYDKREAEAFRAFTDRLMKIVRRYGKRPRAWGALTHAAGTTPVDPTDVTLDIWHNGYYQPLDALKDGFSLICVPDNLVYIVPNAGYYYDFLNCERLFRLWEPCWFEDIFVDPANPKLVGGKFALWNDLGEAGVDLDGTYARMLPAIATLGQKMWAGKVPALAWHDFGRRTAAVRRDRPARPDYLVYDLATGGCETLAAVPVTGWDDRDRSDFLVFKRIREGLYAAVSETTQAQWAHFSDDNPSAAHAPYASVDHVSYVMAKAWIGKLAALTKERGFDIPTNDEWDALAKDGALADVDGGMDEWTSDPYKGDPAIRYLRHDHKTAPMPNCETSVSGTDRTGFRLILRRSDRRTASQSEE